MFRWFYRWRFSRRQRATSPKFANRPTNHFGMGFASHMADNLPRKDSRSAYDILRRRRKRRRLVWLFLLLALIGWLVYEGIFAIGFFQG
ncbi:MAG: hypothetical protein ACFE0O_06125 [Opitutales bacterium]